MPEVTDQMGRTVNVPAKPNRIVSLVPSQTELLFDLGLGDRIAGVTGYCIHPSSQTSTKAKVGGTKNVSLRKVRELEPDLIIGNKEENSQRKVEKLAAEYPVWISDIHDLDDALDMILKIGKITGTRENAFALQQRIREGFDQLPPLSRELSVAYFIWKDPYMVAGPDTFIDEILRRCGFKNAIKSPRYPEITVETLRSASPDLILLSSEPYPFKETHITEFREILPHADARIVDGEMFSWYGSRLLKAAPYLQGLLEQLEKAP